MEHSAENGLLANWNATMLDRYRKRLEKGLHDRGCEQRERYGLCDCRKRARIAAGRTELPELWHQNPMCSGCMGEVSHDGDGWVCETCHVGWGTNDYYDEKGSWNDDYGTHEASTSENYGERMIVLATRPIPPEVGD